MNLLFGFNLPFVGCLCVVHVIFSALRNMMTGTNESLRRMQTELGELLFRRKLALLTRALYTCFFVFALKQEESV